MAAAASDSLMVVDGFVGFAMVVIDGGRWVLTTASGWWLKVLLGSVSLKVGLTVDLTLFPLLSIHLSLCRHFHMRMM